MMKRILPLLLVLLMAAPAWAEDYTKPDLLPLLRTMIRMEALDVRDDTLLDQYAMIAECPLYAQLYENDFKWNQARAALRQSIEGHRDEFPTRYYHDAKLQLDRYDFAKGIYRFAPKAGINHVNMLGIYAVSGMSCGQATTKNLPQSFHAVLGDVIDMPGLPLNQKDAAALLARMDASGNKDHIVHARFKLRVRYIEPWRRLLSMDGSPTTSGYVQSQAIGAQGLRLDAVLESIEFFDGTDMAKPFYVYKEAVKMEPSSGDDLLGIKPDTK